ncbi:MAG: YraN family protein [Pseudomonadota bacterium]
MNHSDARRQREAFGRWGERVAEIRLRLAGYRIVARRSKTKVGEIDLIALRGQRLAFIEVKTRRTRDDARFALTAQQAARILRASQAWMSKNPRYRSCAPAFDLIAVAPWRWPQHRRDVVVPGDHLPLRRLRH